MFDTLNEAYGHLDGYVPIEGKARKNVLSQFATIVNKKYISFLVDENEDVAAFGIALPSICDPLIKHRGKLFPIGFLGVLKCIWKPKELEFALIGVKHKYQNAGFNSIIVTKIITNIINDKIKVMESNPMLESNLSIQNQWKFSNNEVHKKRQTYQKRIDGIVKE